MEPIFTDDELMGKLICAYKLRKLLQREESGHQNALHRRVGVDRDEAEFALCVKMLVEGGWCIATNRERGRAVVLTFNHALKSVTPIHPAELTVGAMSDHPATTKPEAQ